MANKRVHVRFTNDEERNFAEGLMIDTQHTRAFSIGDIDEKNITKLRDRKIIIEELPDMPIIQQTPGYMAKTLPMKFEKDYEAISPNILSTKITETEFCLITLKGPLFKRWKNIFDEFKIKLLEYIPVYSYTAKLTPEQFQRVEDFDFVRNVRMYTIEDTGPVMLSKSMPTPPKQEPRLIKYDIRLHLPEDKERVLNWLNEKRVAVLGSSQRKIRIVLPENSTLKREILDLSEAAEMREFFEPTLYNDVARVLLGVNNTTGIENLSQTGNGQIIGVADTGIDSTHRDFDGQISDIAALGRPNDHSDPHGHGTHVAGSIVGNGNESGGRIRGTAPGAKIFFQSLLDSQGGLGGIPIDLNTLFQQAYDENVRIHNNSWGANTKSMYTFNSLEADEFVAKHRDMLIVIAAGNEGSEAAHFNTQIGFVEWLSVGAPATSKNALTVGASRSSRTQGGYSSLTYGDAWPGDFPNAPIANQPISGDHKSMAAFSSRGPSDDNRIKPDLVAPGTDILSVRSTLAPSSEFWGAYPGKKYAYMGGTSMATPLVSGCAALVREYYVDTRNHEPSAALLKATLVNGTKWLDGMDSTADNSQIPNYHQGFGFLYMPNTIPNKTNPGMNLAFVDTMKIPQRQLVNVGDMFQYKIECSGGDFLRFCLVWTDPPARALQNNLNLVVWHESSPTQLFYGNSGRPRKIQEKDTDNNVEVIRIENPKPGNYVVQVEAGNMLKPPQDFALVATGKITPDFVEVV